MQSVSWSLVALQDAFVDKLQVWRCHMHTRPSESFHTCIVYLWSDHPGHVKSRCEWGHRDTNTEIILTMLTTACSAVVHGKYTAYQGCRKWSEWGDVPVSSYTSPPFFPLLYRGVARCKALLFHKPHPPITQITLFFLMLLCMHEMLWGKKIHSFLVPVEIEMSPLSNIGTCLKIEREILLWHSRSIPCSLPQWKTSRKAHAV